MSMVTMPLAQAAAAGVNGADTAWMLISTALVLLMTPALGFFYGGLARAKNVLNTMMMSFAALGVVAVAWALVGYSIAFAPGGPLVGGMKYAFLRNVGMDAGSWGTMPHLVFFSFQATFAIITVAGATLTFAYITRFWTSLFLGEARGAVTRIPGAMVWPIAALAAIWPLPPDDGGGGGVIGGVVTGGAVGGEVVGGVLEPGLDGRVPGTVVVARGPSPPGVVVTAGLSTGVVAPPDPGGAPNFASRRACASAWALAAIAACWRATALARSPLTCDWSCSCSAMAAL